MLELTTDTTVIPAQFSNNIEIQFVQDNDNFSGWNATVQAGLYDSGVIDCATLIYGYAPAIDSSGVITIGNNIMSQSGFLVISITLTNDDESVTLPPVVYTVVASAGQSNILPPDTDTWQTAVQGYVSQLFNDFTVDQMYPVGSIYTSINSANPSTYFGGAWQRFGQGQVLVGVNESDPDFSTVKATGGEKKHTLIVNEIPSHTHPQNAHTHVATTASAGDHTHVATAASAGSHDHDIGSRSTYNLSGNGFAAVGDDIENVGNYKTSEDGAHTHTLTVENAGAHTHTMTVNNATASNRNTGGGFAHNNLQPYITVYMWLRTA